MISVIHYIDRDIMITSKGAQVNINYNEKEIIAQQLTQLLAIKYISWFVIGIV
ncbi:unnamed protein product [marine sediment metagenome]|uniref:Uncharacterized protein n=1 Tax=marine sediment metagenome TaxID=412755 RepID=X1S072_9ZZZZ